MKDLIVRKSNMLDAEGKGYVHYHAWNEAYTGLIDQAYLDSRTVERSIEMGKLNYDSTYVAEINSNIIGFASFMESRDSDMEGWGEIGAIYILKKYYGKGVGRKLIVKCIDHLEDKKGVFIWVLKDNFRAIAFYEKNNFIKDGINKYYSFGKSKPIEEIRMVRSNILINEE